MKNQMKKNVIMALAIGTAIFTSCSSDNNKNDEVKLL